jgi:IS5 family transposase
MMSGQRGFFDIDERYAVLSAAGDPLQRLASVVDFEVFRPVLNDALVRSDRAKGGRPPYDAVLMFRILVLQALYGLSDEQAEFQLRDRLSFMRFVGLELHEPVPDAKTIWLYREQLKRAGAIEKLFRRFDEVLTAKGYLAMGGQIIDATVVAAPKQKLSADEKAVEACATSHHWARKIGELGHEVRIIPAAYVKPYVSRQKNDAADAAAICEAVTRPAVRSAPIKSAAQQAARVVHRTHELLSRQRVALINALRSHMAEFGVVAAAGPQHVGRLIERISEPATPLPSGRDRSERNPGVPSETIVQRVMYSTFSRYYVVHVQIWTILS